MTRAAASDAVLGVLEFQEVLEHAAGFASSALGRRAVLRRRPSPSESQVRARLELAGQASTFLQSQEGWPFPRLPASDQPLRKLAVDGSVLAPAELAELGALLGAGRSVAGALAGTEGELPALTELAERIVAHREVESALARSVDAEGRVLDTASSELRRIRGRLAGAHNRVVAHLEAVLKGLDDRHRVPEASVSIREGRYVIPVRREGRRTVGGYVHDESATGATVFVEPPSAIVQMNRVRELERAEQREVLRVLRALTDRCRPLAAALAGSLEALVELDALVALARTAARWGGSVPEVAAEGPLRVRRGRHPLLVAAGAEVVAFDLDLDPDERVVIVTGPNTGGKTVFLKSVGLIGALTQSGIAPPVGPGTRLPVFDSFFADVGDQQSIADSLSTFSAHLGNLRELVTLAGPRSLVLIDEPGAGTDPSEGEALARAVIEALAERGCTAVVTSHLGGLKRLAGRGSRIVNASLRFDGERLAPTYRFDKGRPGRSYGLAIARGLGFPAEVIDRAEACRDRSEARLDELLRNLEARERRAARLVDELEDQRAALQARKAVLRERESAHAAREEALAASARDHERRARADARRLLLDARAEVEAVIAGLAERADAEAAREARQAVESAARALDDGAGGGAGAGGAAARRELQGPKGWRRGQGKAGAARRRGCCRATRCGWPAWARAAPWWRWEGGRVVVSVGGVRMTVDGARVAPDEGWWRSRRRCGGDAAGSSDPRRPCRFAGLFAERAAVGRGRPRRGHPGGFARPARRRGRTLPLPRPGRRRGGRSARAPGRARQGDRRAQGAGAVGAGRGSARRCVPRRASPRRAATA